MTAITVMTADQGGNDPVDGDGFQVRPFERPFEDLVDAFCRDQAEMRERLARVGDEAMAVIRNHENGGDGGHDDGQE
jgi:hypothetical protein